MDHANRACRVCLAQEGARNIFQTNLVDDERCSVASVNCLAEKLSYVLMQPVSEGDGMPSSICELCIIQLNVAFNFKRLAIETVRRLGGIAEAHPPNLTPIKNAFTTGTSAPDCAEQLSIVYDEPWVKLEQIMEDCPTATAEISSSTLPPDDSVVPRIAAVRSLQGTDVPEDVKSIQPSTPATVSPTVGPAASCSVADTAGKHEAEKVHLDQTNTAKTLGMVFLNDDLKNVKQDTRYLRSFFEQPSAQHDRATPPTKQEAKQSNIGRTSLPKPSSRNVRKISKKKTTTPHASDQEDVGTAKTSTPVGKKIYGLRIMHQLLRDGVQGSLALTDDEFNLPIAKKVKLRRNSVGYPSYAGV